MPKQRFSHGQVGIVYGFHLTPEQYKNMSERSDRIGHEWIGDYVRNEVYALILEGVKTIDTFPGAQHSVYVTFDIWINPHYMLDHISAAKEIALRLRMMGRPLEINHHKPK